MYIIQTFHEGNLTSGIKMHVYYNKNIFYEKVGMESELSLSLHGKTIEFDNAGYFIPVRHEDCDS